MKNKQQKNKATGDSQPLSLLTPKAGAEIRVLHAFAAPSDRKKARGDRTKKRGDER